MHRPRPLFTSTFVVLALSGCNHSNNPPSSPSPPTVQAGSADPLTSADADFKQHHWDSAISEYTQAAEAGLPSGPSSVHGTNGYAQHQVSLCHEYKGLAAKEVGDYTTSSTELASAVKTDASNQQAKALLKQVTKEARPQGAAESNGAADTTPATTSDGGDDEAKIRAVIKNYLPTYVATYHTVNGRSARLSNITIDVSLSSESEAVADMSYVATSNNEGLSIEVAFHLRKFDNGWKIESRDILRD